MHRTDSYELKDLYLMKQRKALGKQHFDDLIAFNNFPNDISYAYKNLEEY